MPCLQHIIRYTLCCMIRIQVLCAQTPAHCWLSWIANDLHDMDGSADGHVVKGFAINGKRAGCEYSRGIYKMWQCMRRHGHHLLSCKNRASPST